MIKGTGVDIIEISRIEKSLTNEKFVERIFTKKEHDDGAPHVKLYGYFAYIATKRKIYNIFISLSHCKEYAVAQAILEG